MQVEDGKVYRLRDGRKATAHDDYDSHLSGVRDESGFVGYVFRNTGRANKPSGPDVDHDIVALWDDKNADGTYKLPDHTASPCWRNDKGLLICWSPSGNKWNGSFGLQATPSEGRWLPLTEPTFPARKKCSVRLCLVKTPDSDSTLASWHDAHTTYPFKCVVRGRSLETYSTDRVTVLRWLTPEYEDELEAKPA